MYVAEINRITQIQDLCEWVNWDMFKVVFFNSLH